MVPSALLLGVLAVQMQQLRDHAAGELVIDRIRNQDGSAFHETAYKKFAAALFFLLLFIVVIEGDGVWMNTGGQLHVVYERFIAFKTRIYDSIKSTTIYQVAHQQRLRISAALKVWMGKRRSFLRRRWDAARKFSRRRKQEQE